MYEEADMEVNGMDPKSCPKDLNIESNARLVQWSDGKYSLVIGNEYFEVSEEDLQNSGIFLRSTDKKLALLKSSVGSKLHVKPGKGYNAV